MANGNDIKNKVKSLYDIMKEEKIREMEVDSKDYSLYIKRKDAAGNEKTLQGKSKQEAEPKQKAPSEDKNVSRAETIKSPITGIFYQSPSPSAPAYAKEGDVIDAGKTVCIIEAMKVMNEIKTVFKTKILKTLVENGKPVNAGQDLFEIEKV
jgi:acetyl-CoA carboxylase biotin carboxyl carrier protein